MLFSNFPGVWAYKALCVRRFSAKNSLKTVCETIIKFAPANPKPEKVLLHFIILGMEAKVF